MRCWWCGLRDEPLRPYRDGFGIHDECREIVALAILLAAPVAAKEAA